MKEDIFHLGIKGILTNSLKEVLLLQKHPNKRCGTEWDLPGGRIHKGESFHEGLKREVFEETGLVDLATIEFITMEIVPFRIPINDSDVGLIFAIHTCQIPDDAEITLSDEHINYKWVNPKHAYELLKPSYPTMTLTYLASLSTQAPSSP